MRPTTLSFTIQGDDIDTAMRTIGFYFTKSLPPKKYSKSPQNVPIVEEKSKALQFKEDLDRTELKGEIE